MGNRKNGKREIGGFDFEVCNAVRVVVETLMLIPGAKKRALFFTGLNVEFIDPAVTPNTHWNVGIRIYPVGWRGDGYIALNLLKDVVWHADQGTVVHCDALPDNYQTFSFHLNRRLLLPAYMTSLDSTLDGLLQGIAQKRLGKKTSRPSKKSKK